MAKSDEKWRKETNRRQKVTNRSEIGTKKMKMTKSGKSEYMYTENLLLPIYISNMKCFVMPYICSDVVKKLHLARQRAKLTLVWLCGSGAVAIKKGRECPALVKNCSFDLFVIRQCASGEVPRRGRRL